MPSLYIIKIQPRKDNIDYYVSPAGYWTTNRDEAMRFASATAAMVEATIWTCPTQVVDYQAQRYTAGMEQSHAIVMLEGTIITKHKHLETARLEAARMNALDRQLEDLPLKLRDEIADIICLVLRRVALPSGLTARLIHTALNVKYRPEQWEKGNSE